MVPTEVVPVGSQGSSSAGEEQAGTLDATQVFPEPPQHSPEELECCQSLVQLGRRPVVPFLASDSESQDSAFYNVPLPAQVSVYDSLPSQE